MRVTGPALPTGIPTEQLLTLALGCLLLSTQLAIVGGSSSWSYRVPMSARETFSHLEVGQNVRSYTYWNASSAGGVGEGTSGWPGSVTFLVAAMLAIVAVVISAGWALGNIPAYLAVPTIIFAILAATYLVTRKSSGRTYDRRPIGLSKAVKSTPWYAGFALLIISLAILILISYFPPTQPGGLPEAVSALFYSSLGFVIGYPIGASKT